MPQTPTMPVKPVFLQGHLLLSQTVLKQQNCITMSIIGISHVQDCMSSKDQETAWPNNKQKPRQDHQDPSKYRNIVVRLLGNMCMQVHAREHVHARPYPHWDPNADQPLLWEHWAFQMDAPYKDAARGGRVLGQVADDTLS